MKKMSSFLLKLCLFSILMLSFTPQLLESIYVIWGQSVAETFFLIAVFSPIVFLLLASFTNELS